jgi:ABC-2 type transport system permease protein
VPIFDQGYQHWSGELTGHAWRWLAIARHGVRIGRRSLLIRVFLFVAWAPALVLAFFLCIWGLLERKSESVGSLSGIMGFLAPQILKEPRLYRVEIWTLFFSVFLWVELYLSMVLVLLVGPNLISLDLRFNALPLYFSRPLRRIDYFLGKLGVVATFLAMTVVAPALAAYVLGLLFSQDITIVRDTFRVLVGSIAYGLVIALSAGTLILALSSLSRSSRYTGLFWLGFVLVGLSLSLVLVEINREQQRHAFFRERMQRASMRESSGGGGGAANERMTTQRQRALMRDSEQARDEFHAEEYRLSQSDWRPMVSYAANLSRIGEQLLGTRACWEKMSNQFRLAKDRPEFMLDYAGPQYPWHWSAMVLAALFGLSACILNFRVKSLDRLK